MLFNSHQFIFGFLPLAVAGYFCLRVFAGKGASLVWLIAASVTFYAAWDVWNLPVLAASIVVNFVCGTWLAERASRGQTTRLLLAAGITFNLALLGYFKYAGFVADNLNQAFGTSFPVLNLVLPLAISFFTFQEIAYLVDSSRGETKGYRFRDYVLMVTFFPHLIAGPIVNHKILMRQFMSSAALRISEPTFVLGIGLFVFGLTKKVMLADSMAPHANMIFDGVAQGSAPGFAEAWSGALAYTLQLYFDFSGYSDMAIGLGLLFGVRLPLNFNSPYKAVSIVDFWRRWHMTLSAFLRDYLYVSLGGNKRGDARRYVNLAATMVLGGLWHGAGWTFVVWGAFHGIGLAICHFWGRLVGGRSGRQEQGGVIGTTAARGLTLLFVIFGWVLFRADSLGSAGKMMAGMVGLNGSGAGVSLDQRGVVTLASIVALMGVALFAPNAQQWLGYDPERPTEESRSWALRLAAHPLHSAGLACLLVFTLTQMSAVQAFLYFQF